MGDDHPGDAAWSTGNDVRLLVHGVTYFRRLPDELCALRPDGRNRRQRRAGGS